MKLAPTAMSQNLNPSDILSSVSLCMFVRSHGGQAGVSDFVSTETGEKFTKLVFPQWRFTAAAGKDKAGKTLTAAWGRSLPGGLTAAEVAQQKDSLVVIEYKRPENYMVCRQGALNTTIVNCEW